MLNTMQPRTAKAELNNYLTWSPHLPPSSRAYLLPPRFYRRSSSFSFALHRTSCQYQCWEAMSGCPLQLRPGSSCLIITVIIIIIIMWSGRLVDQPTGSLCRLLRGPMATDGSSIGRPLPDCRNSGRDRRPDHDGKPREMIEDVFLVGSWFFHWTETSPGRKLPRDIADVVNTIGWHVLI